MNMKITMTQAEAGKITRLALDGNTRYSHEAVGADDGNINEMADELGGELVTRAEEGDDVAVYLVDGDAVIVADCNGPVAIRLA